MVAVLALTVLCLALAPVLPPQWQPWTQFTLAAVTAMLLTARRGGRPVLARRLRPRDVPVDVVDLVAPDRSLVGCVDGDRVVTTAVELSAGALVDTGVGGDEPADFHGVRLPLAAIARQLDQGGVLLEGIDVVVEGRRAVDGPAGDVYSALVGPLPLISRRRVILLARFDIIRLASDAVDGGEDALQQIVTVATERLRRALVHHGIPCRVLDATELAEMYLASEAAPPAGTGLVVRPGADPRRVVDAMTAVGATAVTEVLRLRRVEGRADVVDVVTTVGVTGVDDTVLPAEAGTPCHRLPTARVLPVPGETLPEAVAGSLARRRIDSLQAVAPPAHGAGQILGATSSGSATALQLAGPHLRSVLLAARPAVCRQVAFRAVASGYRIAVVTDVPERWRPLSAIADESRYRIVDPGSSDAGAPVDAVMWDVDGPLSEGRIDALAGPGGPDVTPPTVIRVDADWDARTTPRSSSTAPPDLVLDGRIDGWISVEPRGDDPHRVFVVSGPGEEDYVRRGPLTPAGAVPAASPDRP